MACASEVSLSEAVWGRGGDAALAVTEVMEGPLETLAVQVGVHTHTRTSMSSLCVK